MPFLKNSGIQEIMKNSKLLNTHDAKSLHRNDAMQYDSSIIEIRKQMNQKIAEFTNERKSAHKIGDMKSYHELSDKIFILKQLRKIYKTSKMRQSIFAKKMTETNMNGYETAGSETSEKDIPIPDWRDLYEFELKIKRSGYY